MTSFKVPPHQSADMSTSTSAKHAFWQPSLVPFFERLLSTHIIYSCIIYYCILYCSIICSSFLSQMPTSVPNKRYNQIPPQSYCTFNTRPHRAVRGLALIFLNLPMQATYMPGWSSLNLRTQWYPSKPTQCDVTEGFPHTLPRPEHSVLITYWHAFKGLSRPSVVNASIFYILLWSQDSKPLFLFNSIQPFKLPNNHWCLSPSQMVSQEAQYLSLDMPLSITLDLYAMMLSVSDVHSRKPVYIPPSLNMPLSMILDDAGSLYHDVAAVGLGLGGQLGFRSAPTSGTDINVPVKSHFTKSHVSSLLFAILCIKDVSWAADQPLILCPWRSTSHEPTLPLQHQGLCAHFQPQSPLISICEEQAMWCIGLKSSIQAKVLF